MGNRIIIVCSGSSAKGFVPPDNAIVISVNNTISWLSRADYFFTLDPEGYNLDAINNQREGVKYCVAFEKGVKFQNCTMFERIRNTTLDGVHGKSGTLNGHKTLSEDKTKIHTGNSGYGALGLAYHIGFEKLVFIGLDGDGKKCDGMYGGDLSHLPELFDSVIAQVDGRVVNASLNSNINSFPKMTHKDAMEWIFK